MPSSPAQEQRIQAERLRTAEIRRQREQEVGGHVQAIKAIRGDLETKLRELQGHCERLHQTTRRALNEDGSDARYRLYHTAQLRMVGAMSQALKRAEAADRLLVASQAERQDQERREREKQTQERVESAVRDVFDLQLPKDDDFESLFGEEVTDAS